MTAIFGCIVAQAVPGKSKAVSCFGLAKISAVTSRNKNNDYSGNNFYRVKHSLAGRVDNRIQEPCTGKDDLCGELQLAWSVRMLKQT